MQSWLSRPLRSRVIRQWGVNVGVWSSVTKISCKDEMSFVWGLILPIFSFRLFPFCLPWFHPTSLTLWLLTSPFLFTSCPLYTSIIGVQCNSSWYETIWQKHFTKRQAWFKKIKIWFQGLRCLLTPDTQGISLSCTHTRAIILSLNMRWAGCLVVISGREGFRGMHLLCVCVGIVFYRYSPGCPVGHRKDRQMAVFRSTAGQHMAVRVLLIPCLSGGSWMRWCDDRKVIKGEEEKWRWRK